MAATCDLFHKGHKWTIRFLASNNVVDGEVTNEKWRIIDSKPPVAKLLDPKGLR